MKPRFGIVVSLFLMASVTALGQAPQAPNFARPGTSTPPAQGRQYTGAPINVDFQDADLRMVIRQLADIGQINIVVDPTVRNEKVNVKLTQVPWDQVLEIVLKNHQLGWESVGNVGRVAPLELIQKEREQQEASIAVRQSETFELNYAKGSDLEKMFNSQGVLSKYAKTQFDERTNTLLVTGRPDDIEAARKLITRLDAPEKQVEIEARIIETDHNSARALGIQWGINGRMLPELGNTTSLAFPNNGTISGRATNTQGRPAQQGPNDNRQLSPIDTTGSAVNLPVPGATSAMGISLGAINGALNLDVALSALETKGKLKILSAPKVTTQNNVLAEVTQGFEIPFQTVSNNTVTVNFRDAALKLTVTPHITGADTIVMDVALENGFPDFSQAVNGNPSIKTQKATTRVQVTNGDTTAIGGIVINKESTANDQTPGVGRVPLLGWLFKRNSSSNENQELLIFITPRVIR